jgi:hypothetical protein
MARKKTPPLYGESDWNAGQYVDHTMGFELSLVRSDGGISRFRKGRRAR